MIETRKLTKVYRTDTVETTALADLSLTIESGELTAVMGPSGSGKSTLLNVLGLIDPPTSGELRFLGEEVSGRSERQLADLRKRHIGFIFQSFNLIDELDVAKNVELPLVYLGVPAAERRQRVEEVLGRVEMSHRRDHYPQQLSGGQQQRVAIARAVVARPKLLLADEPTGNLDSGNGTEVMELLTQLNEEGATIIMVTHSSDCAAYCRRTLTLADGRLVS